MAGHSLEEEEVVVDQLQVGQVVGVVEVVEVGHLQGEEVGVVAAVVLPCCLAEGEEEEEAEEEGVVLVVLRGLVGEEVEVEVEVVAVQEALGPFRLLDLVRWSPG